MVWPQIRFKPIVDNRPGAAHNHWRSTTSDAVRGEVEDDAFACLTIAYQRMAASGWKQIQNRPRRAITTVEAGARALVTMSFAWRARLTTAATRSTWVKSICACIRIIWLSRIERRRRNASPRIPIPELLLRSGSMAAAVFTGTAAKSFCVCARDNFRSGGKKGRKKSCAIVSSAPVQCSMRVALLRPGLFGVLLLVGPWRCLAQSGSSTNLATTNILSITWNPSPSESVAGYALYWGLSAGTCTNRLDFGNVTTVTLLLARLETNAVYHFTVVARDDAGDESSPSNMIQYRLSPTWPLPRSRPRRPYVGNWVPPEPPRVPPIEFEGRVGESYQVQTTTNLLDWEVVLTTNCVQNGKVSIELPYSPAFTQRFFRLVRP